MEIEIIEINANELDSLVEDYLSAYRRGKKMTKNLSLIISEDEHGCIAIDNRFGNLIMCSQLLTRKQAIKWCDKRMEQENK